MARAQVLRPTQTLVGTKVQIGTGFLVATVLVCGLALIGSFGLMAASGTVGLTEVRARSLVKIKTDQDFTLVRKIAPLLSTSQRVAIYGFYADVLEKDKQVGFDKIVFRFSGLNRKFNPAGSENNLVFYILDDAGNALSQAKINEESQVVFSNFSSILDSVNANHFNLAVELPAGIATGQFRLISVPRREITVKSVTENNKVRSVTGDNLNILPVKINDLQPKLSFVSSASSLSSMNVATNMEFGPLRLELRSDYEDIKVNSINVCVTDGQYSGTSRGSRNNIAKIGMEVTVNGKKTIFDYRDLNSNCLDFSLNEGVTIPDGQTASLLVKVITSATVSEETANSSFRIKVASVSATGLLSYLPAQVDLSAAGGNGAFILHATLPAFVGGNQRTFSLNRLAARDVKLYEVTPLNMALKKLTFMVALDGDLDVASGYLALKNGARISSVLAGVKSGNSRYFSFDLNQPIYFSGADRTIQFFATEVTGLDGNLRDSDSLAVYLLNDSLAAGRHSADQVDAKTVWSDLFLVGPNNDGTLSDNALEAEQWYSGFLIDGARHPTSTMPVILVEY